MTPRVPSVSKEQLERELAAAHARKERAADSGRPEMVAKHGYRYVLVGYAAGLELMLLRDELRASIRARLDAGLGWQIPRIAIVRLFGLTDEVAAIADAVGPNDNTIASFLLHERAPWTERNYPDHQWQRRECEFVDRILDDAEDAGGTLAKYFDAWTSEVEPQTIEMAYEIAAIARICGTDDSALADEPHYPYELARSVW